MTKLVFVIFKALMFQTLLVFRSEAQCFNATLMAEKQFGLSDKQFWRAKAHDVEQCAVLCVRRSTCSSINYDTQSRLCELNNGTKADTPTKTGPYLLYSEFKSWPSSIDPHCYSRPCTHLDVCLPGSLANGNNDECSHACIRTVYDVCPMPEVGVSNGRTVGTQNTLTCGKGFIGGGTAKCLDSKQWDKELSPCIPIYRHPCNDSVLCSKINATCHNDTCECVGQANSFDDALKECVIDCGEPDALEPSLNATYVNADDKFTRSITCNDEYYPTAGSVSTINCTADGWDQVNFSCYTCDVPPSVSNATLTGTGRTRQYECETGLYHNPKTGSGEITCQENGEWNTTGFKCGGLRLKNGTQQQVLKSYSGYLEIFDGGKWKAVHKNSWTWQATMVACKTLFNFTYGGTYHTEWFGGENPNRESELIELDNLACTGNESVLEQCTYQARAKDDSKFNEEIAVTCFNYNITTPDSVKTFADPINSKSLLLVNISGMLGAMCNKLGGTNIKVACQSINSSWTSDGESEENSVESVTFYTNYVHCVNDKVPHLFYCENNGWGYNSNCEMNKLWGIKCKSN